MLTSHVGVLRSHSCDCYDVLRVPHLFLASFAAFFLVCCYRRRKWNGFAARIEWFCNIDRMVLSNKNTKFQVQIAVMRTLLKKTQVKMLDRRQVFTSMRSCISLSQVGPGIQCMPDYPCIWAEGAYPNSWEFYLPLHSYCILQVDLFRNRVANRISSSKVEGPMPRI